MATGRGIRIAAAVLASAAVLTASAVHAQTVGKPGGKPQDAAQKPEAAAPKKVDPSIALRAYDSGTKAFEAGRFADAVSQLSTALSNGGLPSQQMAKAMYYRGAAYRKQGKPAQAISDLTTAVWVKNGLADADRALAIDERRAAYAEAGLGEPPQVGSAPLDAPASGSGTAVAKEQPASGGAQTAAAAPAASSGSSSGVGSFFNSIFGGSTVQVNSPAPVPPATPAASETVVAAAAPAAPAAEAPATSVPVAAAPPSGVPNPFGVPETTTVAAAPKPQAPAPVADEAAVAASAWAPQSGAAPQTAAAPAPVVVATATPPPAAPAQWSPAAVEAPAAQPAATAPSLSALPAEPQAAEPQVSGPSPLANAGAAISNAGKSVGSFFSNMFSPQGAASGTGETVGAANTEVATASTGPSAAVSSWTQTTDVAPAGAKAKRAAPVTQTAAIPTPPAPAAAATASGKYRLQVAAVRSNEEAQRVLAALKAQHTATIGTAEPFIDEAAVGNFGTFYRVRLGPFADAKAPGQMCSKLRPHGFDCLVVTQ